MSVAFNSRISRKIWLTKSKPLKWIKKSFFPIESSIVEIIHNEQKSRDLHVHSFQ